MVHTLEEQVEAATKKVFAHLHLIHQLYPYLNWGMALCTVTHALTTSHLNYCNAFYMGLFLKTIVISTNGKAFLQGRIFIRKYRHVINNSYMKHMQKEDQM